MSGYCISYSYPVDKLDKMWQTKSLAMMRIIAAKGGNSYNLHRTAREKAADAKRQKK